MVLRREWQPLEEIVGVALGRLSRSLSDHPLATKLPPELPLVHVDATLLAQALFNLVDNATHHTPPGTAIELRAEADCSEVIVSVADSGPGIPAGQEERVFEKFYRGPPGTIGGGSGLGLTISRGIIVAHGGRIWVEKRVGGGAVFRFALPRVGTPPSMPPDHKFM
jgi:two-component system sensor histidine kinase KdpD